VDFDAPSSELESSLVGAGLEPDSSAALADLGASVSSPSLIDFASSASTGSLAGSGADLDEASSFSAAGVVSFLSLCLSSWCSA